MTMCDCDRGFNAPDCSYRTCPYGDDPITVPGTAAVLAGTLARSAAQAHHTRPLVNLNVLMRRMQKACTLQSVPACCAPPGTPAHVIVVDFNNQCSAKCWKKSFGQ